MEEQYGKVVFDEATIAAEMIDGDMVEKYYATGEKRCVLRESRAGSPARKADHRAQILLCGCPRGVMSWYTSGMWGRKAKRGVRRLLDTDSYYGGGNEVMHAAFSANAKRNILFTLK